MTDDRQVSPPENVLLNTIFSIGGEVGEWMRSVNWTASPLGSANHWSPELVTTLQVSLPSPGPMLIWWGKEQLLLCNDAGRSLLDIPLHALGKPSCSLEELKPRLWQQAQWQQINSHLTQVWTTQHPLQTEPLEILVDRQGVILTTFQRHFHNPIFNAAGQVVGILTTITDVTQQIIATQQMDWLQAFIQATEPAETVEAVCSALSRTIGERFRLFPFSLLYLVCAEKQQAILADITLPGFDSVFSDHLETTPTPIASSQDSYTPIDLTPIDLVAPSSSSAEQSIQASTDPWKFREIMQTDRSDGGNHDRLNHQLKDHSDGLIPCPLPYQLQQYFSNSTQAGTLPSRDKPNQAVVLPLRQSQRMIGFWVVGIAPDRPFDWQDKRFLNTVSGQIATALANAQAQAEIGRSQREAEVREQQIRQTAEAALHESRSMFENFMSYMPGSVFLKDEQGRYVYVNPHVLQIAQSHPSNIIGKTDFELVSEATAQQFQTNDRTILATNKPMETLETIPHPDGYEQYWMTLKFPITLASGERLVGGMSFDVTERKHLEMALRESEERWRLALEAAQMVAWDCNLETNEVQWSNNVDAIFDFPAGSFSTNLESAWAVMHPDDRPATAKTWQQAIEQGLPYEAEFRLLKADGAIRWIYDRGEVKHDVEGKPMRVVGVSFDITRRKQAEAEKLELLERERTAREQAEVANRVKDEFLAVLSHELRSPLNPILGWAQLLQKRTPSPSMLSRGLEVIERNAKLQTQLIQDLLDVSKILRGKMGLNVALVDLKTIIEAAIETMHLSAEAKFIQVSTFLAPNVGQVSGDMARLQQVVWNLLSNAIKFTDPYGRVEIRLKPVDTHAEIQVQDTGKGIAPDFLPYVFESFRQADSTITRQFGGLGLGLAIVRYLVELHGGTVWVESPGEGQGATFTVRLPLATVHQSSIAPDSTPAEEKINHRVLQAVQILVVDDDADTREFLTFVLEQAGATVTAVSSAIEALHYFMQSPPDVLLSDIGMPTMDGYSLIRRLRSLPPPQGGQTPAIALTAYAGQTDQHQAQVSGFQLHLAKPIEPQALIEAISNLLQPPR